MTIQNQLVNAMLFNKTVCNMFCLMVQFIHKLLVSTLIRKGPTLIHRPSTLDLTLYYFKTNITMHIK